MSLQGDLYERRLIWRHRMGQGFEWLCRLATIGALAFLLILLGSILIKAFTPGRGKGLAAVSMPASGSHDSGSHDVVGDDLSYRVSNISGGQFEEKDRPGIKQSIFTLRDVQQGKIVFNHDGRRVTPLFDLTIDSKFSADKASQSWKKVGPGREPEGVAIPSVHPPKPANPWGWLTWRLLTHGNSDDPIDSGIMPGLWGSLWLVGLTTLMAVPLGVGAAVYLEEYSKPTLTTKFIQLNISNLAGVPSIVYGILGFTVFSRMFGIFDKEKTYVEIGGMLGLKTIEISLPLGPVVLAGACTLTLLSLPLVIITSQEALRSIPASIRHAAYALGASRWQTIWHQVLPAALPGILTGVILSLSRAIGEAAPLAVIGVAAQISWAPGEITGVGDLVQHPEKLIKAPFDRFTALPIQIYSWVNDAAPNFEHVAAAGILVLLITLLSLNGAAIFIRQRFQRKNNW